MGAFCPPYILCHLLSGMLQFIRCLSILLEHSVPLGTPAHSIFSDPRIKSPISWISHGTDSLTFHRDFRVSLVCA
jgi:hypothetical protein